MTPVAKVVLRAGFAAGIMRAHRKPQHIERTYFVTDHKRPRPDDYFSDWKEREALAEDLIPLVGRLARERNIKCFCYDRSMVNKSVLDLAPEDLDVATLSAGLVDAVIYNVG